MPAIFYHGVQPPPDVREGYARISRVVATDDGAVLYVAEDDERIEFFGEAGSPINVPRPVLFDHVQTFADMPWPAVSSFFASGKHRQMPWEGTVRSQSRRPNGGPQ